MAVEKKEVVYCKELDEVLNLVTLILGDVVAKKPVSQVVSDAVPALMVALTGVQDLGLEIGNAKALDNTIALKLAELKEILMPKPVV